MILNLTQHAATAEQIAAGVRDLNPHHGEIQQLKALLTFESLPTAEDVYERAYAIAALAQSYFVDVAMIGGAPYLMGALERQCIPFLSVLARSKFKKMVACVKLMCLSTSVLSRCGHEYLRIA